MRNAQRVAYRGRIRTREIPRLKTVGYYIYAFGRFGIGQSEMFSDGFRSDYYRVGRAQYGLFEPGLERPAIGALL